MQKVFRAIKLILSVLLFTEHLALLFLISMRNNDDLSVGRLSAREPKVTNKKLADFSRQQDW